MRAHQIDSVLGNVAAQTYQPLQLVLVLHGLDEDEGAIRRRAREAGIDDVVVLRADRSLPLGSVMNLGCEAAGGEYVSKMDDDNFYGPHYCEDLMHAFTYADARIVGKWAVYTFLGSSGTLVLRFPDQEHRYVRLVQGGTLTMPHALWEDQRFPDLPRAIDTQFLRTAHNNGVRVYASDRFNYVSVRAADTSDHTWKISDDALLHNGIAQVFGATFEHVLA
jgi:glycosyltransferase involved in cell wall biosynthesis